MIDKKEAIEEGGWGTLGLAGESCEEACARLGVEINQSDTALVGQEINANGKDQGGSGERNEVSSSSFQSHPSPSFPPSSRLSCHSALAPLLNQCHELRNIFGCARCVEGTAEVYPGGVEEEGKSTGVSEVSSLRGPTTSSIRNGESVCFVHTNVENGKRKHTLLSLLHSQPSLLSSYSLLP